MGTNPPFLPRDNTDFFDGKVWKQTTHHQDGQVLQENWNLHLSGGHSTNFSTIRGLKVLQTEYPSSYFGPMEGTTYIHGYYNINSEWVYLDSTRELSYLGGSEPVMVITKYLYENPVHAQVTNKKTYSSEGKLIELRSSYAHDAPTETEMNSVIFSELQTRHMIGIPLKTETWLDGSRKDGTIVNFNTYPDGTFQTSSFQVLEGTNYKPRIRYQEYSNGNIQMVSKEKDVIISYIWGYNNALPIAEVTNASLVKTVIQENASSPFSSGSSSSQILLTSSAYVDFSQNVTIAVDLLPSNVNPPYQGSQDIDVMIKIEKGGLLITTLTFTFDSFVSHDEETILLSAGTYTLTYLGKEHSNDPDYSFSGTFNSQYTKVRSTLFHTSFEEDTQNTSTIAKTGSKSHVGAYPIVMPSVAGEYLITYWEKPSGGSWSYHEINKTVSSSNDADMIIGASGSLLDEVRLYPVGAQMTTYTYEPLNGITSVTDRNNITTHYDYDDIGRLKTVKDHDNNVMKTYSYHYKE